MGATARDSTLYTNYETNKYVPDARDRHGRVIPVYFELTVISASAGSDTYKLFQLLAAWSVLGLFCTTNGLGASAGTGTTCQIGDSGNDARYMAATDFDLVNAQGSLAYAGVGYRPSANTDVVAKAGATAWVVGKLVKGHFLLIPAS